MNDILRDMIKEMEPHHNAASVSSQMTRMAKVLAILAEEQANAAKQMEQHTRRLVVLTWVLAGLTAALLLRDVVIPKNPCTTVKTDKIQPAKNHATE